MANLSQVGMKLDQITADAGYSSGKALQFCEENNIDAYIPNFGQYKPEREGFIYNPVKDQYECQKEGGNKAILNYKGIKTDSKGYEKKQYRSSETVCKSCPLREKCCGLVTQYKKLEESIHKPYYDRMHEKLNRNKEYSKRISKLRSSTVEPVLGTLINFVNMKKINSRGMKQANKHVLMAALTYNLKKYLKYICPKVVSSCQMMNMFEQNSQNLIIKLFLAFSRQANFKLLFHL